MNQRTSEQPFDRDRFARAPCYICGYNGAGYYQPGIHPCAAQYHGYILSNRTSNPPCGDAALQMLIGTYEGQTSQHAKDVLKALRELQARRAADETAAAPLLIEVQKALTCGKHGAHYCPNCDKSLSNIKQKVDAAVAAHVANAGT